MPFSKSAQRRGGRRSATDSQKQAAREWALKNKPWLKSSGPKSTQGKAISCLNAHKPFFRRVIKSSEVADFERECEATERFILLLRSQLEATGVQYQLTIKRRAGGQYLQAWAYFAVRIELIGDEQQLPQVWRRLNVLVELCGW